MQTPFDRLASSPRVREPISLLGAARVIAWIAIGVGVCRFVFTFPIMVSQFSQARGMFQNLGLTIATVDVFRAGFEDIFYLVESLAFGLILLVVGRVVRDAPVTKIDAAVGG